MSNSGSYQILANDGKQDELLFARATLISQIKNLERRNMERGLPDPTPKLVDIERTHIIFFNSSFKSYVPVGSEYSKVRAASGTNGLGSDVVFSIPQYGDFFSDMVISVRMSELKATVGVVPPFPAAPGNTGLVTTTTSQVSGIEDAVNGVYTKFTQEYVNESGQVLAVGSPAQNHVKYCDYPGIRLLDHVTFKVNGNNLDEYSYNAPTFRRKGMIQPNKVDAYDKLIGQEVEVNGVSDLIDVEGQSKYPLDVLGSLGKDVSSKTVRKVSKFVSGPQTPKPVQPVLNMLIPIQLWFCRDISQSIPSIAIPYGQRFLEIKLCPQKELVFTSPGIRLRTTVEKMLSAGADMGTDDAVDVSEVETYQFYDNVNVSNSVISPEYKLEHLELIYNNHFTEPVLHNIYIRRVSFTIIRIHREQVFSANNAEGAQQLVNLKFPVEYFFLGARPKTNVMDSNPNKARDWHKFHIVNDHVSEEGSLSQSKVATDATLAWSALGTALKVNKHLLVTSRSTISTATELFDSFTVEAQSIKLQPDGISPGFFRDYIPYKHGLNNFTNFSDPGLYLFSFALYPGTQQPSGHLNLSRSREFYLNYKGQAITASNPAEVVVVASAINFLLLGEGSAVLRYAS